MTPEAILATARGLGVTLTPDGTNIRIRPAGVLPADVRACLVKQKPALLALLAGVIPCNLGSWEEVRRCAACGYIHARLDNPPCSVCGRTDLTVMLVIYGDRYCAACRPAKDLQWER